MSERVQQQNQSKSFGLLGQSGVALADILANSVAVILILIAVTLTVQQKKAQDELEQNADITTILARQLATSVVFNDLPTSPPARLHDYHSCEIPHDCNPYLYPIIEMHDGYIRIFNNNTKIYRNELLRKENAFDLYIKNLRPEEILNLRLDVYSVSEYYLTLGILKEHNASPRHWHYLGESVPPLKNQILNEERIAGQQQDQSSEGLDEGQSKGDSEGSNDSESSNSSNQQSQGQNPSQMPEGTELADSDSRQSLQYDSLLPPADGGSSNEVSDNTNEQPGGPTESESSQSNKTPTTLFEALTGMMAESQGLTPPEQSGQGSSGKRSMRVHVPNAGKSTGNEGKSSDSVNLPADEYHRVVIAYILTMLEQAHIQKTLALPQAREWLAQLAQSPESIQQLPLYPLIDSLAMIFDHGHKARSSTLQQTVIDASLRDNQLQIPYNVAYPAPFIKTYTPPVWLDKLTQAQNVQPALLMRLYPSLFKGEVLEFPEGYTVIVHPDEAARTIAQWRPIAVLDAQLNDISLGFVYASIANEQLVIHAGENQLLLNKFPISDPQISAKDNTEILTPILWLFGLFTLLVLLSRMRIRTRRESLKSI